MPKDETSGLKSAFDLAMERMAQRGEGMTRLSADQKTSLADLSARTKAKLAEIEIMFGKKLAEVTATGDAEKIAKVEEQMRMEKAKLQRQDEEARAKIRGN
jgi:hypothetical protein